jgi:hypothetical protein
VGPLEDLEFPDLCPACGASATGALLVRKVFLNTEGEDPRHVLAEVRVPFCASCIVQHEQEAAQQPRVRAYRFPKLLDLALVSIWGVMGIFFLYVTLGVLGKGATMQAWILGYIGLACLVFWVIGMRRAARVPWYERVPPQTSVTSAFDFGDETLELFEKSGRSYAIRNGEFAERFATLNADKHPSRSRKRGQWKMIVVLVVLLAILAAMIVWGDRVGMS